MSANAGPVVLANIEHAQDDNGSEVIEIPRPDIQPKQHYLPIPPILINTTPWRHYTAFFLLALFDISMNAAAGSAAATVGAKLNRKPLTTRVVQLGALAGATKAGITTFRELILNAKINIVLTMLLILMFHSFGICLVLTAEICNLALQETPRQYLIAAVVAAIPLFPECIRDLEPKPDNEGEMDYISRPLFSIFLLVTNPLGGYVFARMASNQGFPISNYHAACSAGAAYAIITFLSRAITACVTCIQTTDNNVTHNVFGRYEWYQPDPVPLTEEEYQRISAMTSKAIERGVNRARKMLRRSEWWRKTGLKFLANMVSCVCCMKRDKKKEAKAWLRTKADEQSDMTTQMDNWIGEVSSS